MRGAALSAVAGEPAETTRYLGGWAMGDDGALSMGGTCAFLLFKLYVVVQVRELLDVHHRPVNAPETENFSGPSV
jgi:hypothetical protein